MLQVVTKLWRDHKAFVRLASDLRVNAAQTVGSGPGQGFHRGGNHGLILLT